VPTRAVVVVQADLNRPGFRRDSLLGSGDQADQVAQLVQGLVLDRRPAPAGPVKSSIRACVVGSSGVGRRRACGPRWASRSSSMNSSHIGGPPAASTRAGGELPVAWATSVLEPPVVKQEGQRQGEERVREAA
jgi:hypothetical protein